MLFYSVPFYVLTLRMPAANVITMTCACSSENSLIAYMIRINLANHVYVGQWWLSGRVLIFSLMISCSNLKSYCLLSLNNIHYPYSSVLASGQENV